MNELDCDVAIVGGGLVGASLAIALAGSELRVVLIEAATPPVSAAAWDERCIALNDASQRIFERAGVWSALVSEAEPIRATHISERGRFGVARFNAADAGLEALGYNAPLRAIGAVLSAAMARAPRLTILQPAALTSLEIRETEVSACIKHADATEQTLRTRLLVAADGAQSAVRRQLGIAAQTRDYEQHAIVSAVRTARPHLGVAYERFTPDGPLALIPKPGDACSLVWTVPSARAEAMLQWPDDEYLAAAERSFGGRLGRLNELGARRAYPLSRVMSEQLTAARVAVIGNAAQSLHPVAAQGFNLGLRDVSALALLLVEAFSKGADPGAAELLAEYAAQRARDRAHVSGFTDFLVRTFSNRVPGLAQARHWGLVAADLLPGVRESLLRQHLGHLGLPPEAVMHTMAEPT